MTKDQIRYQDPKRRKYLIGKVADRRLELRRKAVEILGGKCLLCGYNRCIDALCAHHLNPDEKVFGLSYKGMCRSWEKVLEELKKCVLLCSNCHTEVHDGISIIPTAAIEQSKAWVEDAESLFRRSQTERQHTVNMPMSRFDSCLRSL